MTSLSRDLTENGSQTVLQQDTTAVSVISNPAERELSNTVTAALNYRRIDKTDLPVAKTLCARDHKGFGTGFNTMNGVIEWKSKN